MGFYASLPLFAGTGGDFIGGWLSDLWLKRTGNITVARRAIGVTGFSLASVAILPATLTGDPLTSVLFSCLAVFGLELTIGVSWALTLDIGADYAGSVSAVMNACGNIGGAISPALLAYLVQRIRVEPAVSRGLVCVSGCRYPVFENRCQPPYFQRGRMTINQKRCVACGNCTYVCPMGAIYIDPVIKRATINRKECVECYACYNGLSQEHLNPTMVRTMRSVFKVLRLRFDPEPDVCPDCVL